MLIAKQKRKDNIAEYILYLWQVEDLLRALSLDGDKIFTTLVTPLDIAAEKKQEVFFWYMGIVNLLKEEKKEANGHTFHSLHLIRELNDIHLYLLKKESRYKGIFDEAQNDIDSFREKSGGNIRASDIEICFDALYAKLLLNLKREPISAESQAAFGHITTLIAYLSAKFRRIEQGEEAYDPDGIN